MYGLDDAGMTRLTAVPAGAAAVEKGVRMVQLFSGGAFGSPRINWDGHENVQENHSREAERIDQLPLLLPDLRQRGMLDDTLVLFTTEDKPHAVTEVGGRHRGLGRDHSNYGFRSG